MRTITFAVTDNPSDLFDVDTDEITTERTDTDGNLVIGEYEYESEPAFGSSTTADGELYWDQDSGLVALVTYHDRPKATTLFRKFGEATGSELNAPEYPQEASAQFYQTFGFNGYTTSFREGLMDYGLHSDYQYIEPDEKMKERAMHSRRDPSDDWLDEITNELIEDGYYVSSMDCMFEEDGGSYSFSNPMRVTGIPADEWDTDLRDLIFQRMAELYTNNVPTTDEVLN